MRKYAEVTFVIIIINVVIFILETIAWGSTNTQVAVNFWAFYSPIFTLQPRRAITACFLHFGIAHLVMNMYALYSIWPMVESSFWKRRYALVYLLSWIAWNLTVYWVDSITWNYALNAWASWAIFWILWAILSMVLSLPKEIRSRINVNSIVYSILLSLAPGLFVTSISMTAHLWGLIWWFIISYLLILIKKPKISSN